ncbi:MAG: sulfatase family protein [Candidatus Helarchaeota archaeon]
MKNKDFRNPNIILFITHDQGQAVGIYNSEQNPIPIKTLNLDKIAKKGVYFTNYFCTAPQCSPSRASIQTSKYPHQNGIMGLINEGWTLKSKFTMPKFFNEIGYSTNLIGFQHEVKNPQALGYSKIGRRKIAFRYSSSVVIDECIEFLENYDHNSKPFFLNIGVTECHRPFQIFSEPINIKKVKVPPYLPDTAQIRRELAEFFGAVSDVDRAVGKLYHQIEKLGINKDTLFIFTTDHGIDFPRSKCTLYDPGIKTALLMYCPGMELFKGGKKIDAMISNIDLFPTLIDLFVDKNFDNQLEGKSFLPILKGKSSYIHDEIFMEKTYHNIYDPMRGLRTLKYKYIRNFRGSEQLNFKFQIPDDTFSYKCKKSIKFEHSGERPLEELYDLINDPLERINLAKNPEYQNTLQYLRAQLNKWMINTNDPLLKGFVYPPQKYIKNRNNTFKKILRKNSVYLFEHLINFKIFRTASHKILKQIK